MDHSALHSYGANAMDIPYPFDNGLETGIVPHHDDWVNHIPWDTLDSTPYADLQQGHPKPPGPDASQRSIAFLNHPDPTRSMDQVCTAMSPCPEECHEECHSPDCNDEDCEAGLIECTDAACMSPNGPGSCTENGTLCAGELPQDVLNGAVQLHSLRPHQPSEHFHYPPVSYSHNNTWVPHGSIHSSSTQYDTNLASSTYGGTNLFNTGHAYSQPFFSIDEYCTFEGDNSLCMYHNTQHDTRQHGYQQVLDYSNLPTNMPLTDPSTSSSSPVPQMTYAASQEPTPSSISPYPSPHQNSSDSMAITQMYSPMNLGGEFYTCHWNVDDRLCLQHFPSRELLQKHIQETHTVPLTKGVGFVCRWHGCSRLERGNNQSGKPLAFAQRSKLDRHIQSHTGFKASICPKCQKLFSTPQTLESHMRTHTGAKPFVCQEPGCGYRAAQASQLTMHTRTKHTKEKPLSCDVCGAKFAESSNLSKHRKIHMPEENVRCHCGKTFRRRDQLKRHEKTHLKRQLKDERRRSELSAGFSGRSSVSTSVGLEEQLDLPDAILKQEDMFMSLNFEP